MYLQFVFRWPFLQLVILAPLTLRHSQAITRTLSSILFRFFRERAIWISSSKAATNMHNVVHIARQDILAVREVPLA